MPWLDASLRRDRPPATANGGSKERGCGRASDLSPLATTLGGDVAYKTTTELEAHPPGLRAGMSAEVGFERVERSAQEWMVPFVASAADHLTPRPFHLEYERSAAAGRGPLAQLAEPLTLNIESDLART